MTVLEIGTGTGILSAFAVRAGADHVYTIEASDLADTARHILARNGLADRVTVLSGFSFDVELPKRADLLVTETLGHFGFDEAILELTHDARKRLLTKRAPILPAVTRLVVAPVHAPDFATLHGFWRSSPYGYDVTDMERVCSQQSYVSRFSHDDYLAPPAVFVERTMGLAPRYPLRGHARFAIESASVVHGFAVSFVADFGPGEALHSRGSLSWNEGFLPVDDAFAVDAGKVVEVDVALQKPKSASAVVWSGGVVGDPTRSFRGRSV